jgi:hypothetical protein
MTTTGRAGHVTLVLVGEVVTGLVKQRRGTLTTPAPESGP